MKKILILIILLLLPFALLAATPYTLGLDLASLDSLYFNNLALRAEASYYFSPDLRCNIPFGYYAENNRNLYLSMLNAGLYFDYFPFLDYNFYVGVALLDYYYLFGYDVPEDPQLIINSTRAGYVFKFPKFQLDIRLSVLDLVSATKESSEVLFKTFGQIDKYKISIVASVAFD